MSIVLTDKQVTTKKPHTCHGCVKRFEAGTMMQYQSGVNEGGFWSIYLCSSCNKLWDAVDWDDCDGLFAGELVEYSQNAEVEA